MQDKNHFIAEGRYLVERLLQTDWSVLTVLCTPPNAIYFQSLADQRCPVEIKTNNEMEECTGFPFHRGVLAICKRPEPMQMEAYLGTLPSTASIVILPHTCELENIGSIIRSAAAFAINAVFYSNRCADPFARKALRCSMGAIFQIPVIPYHDDARLLTTLQAHNFQLTGATLTPTAVPLFRYRFAPKSAIILGNEAAGLGVCWETACHDFITIPISRGVDSLNVGVAAGIIFQARYQQQENGSS